MTWIFALVSGILYRLGGSSKEEYPFLPIWLKKSYIRDLGIPVLFIAYMALEGCFYWNLILCSLLLYASLTTYWKILNPLFKKPTSDGYWFNWLMTGICYGLTMFPFAWEFNLWPWFWGRVAVLGLITMLWSEIWDIVEIEEIGRGVFIILTLPILI